MSLHPLMPRQPVPALCVTLITGQTFVLGTPPPANFDLLVFYRGLHCPVCAKYLLDLERAMPDFASRGVRVTALSMDGLERAQSMAHKVKAHDLAMGYGLSLAEARQWGLYVSTSRGVTSIGIEEPALFSEPGVFLVRPDGTLYYGAVQTMPFARPAWADLLAAIDFALNKNYPARGDYQADLG